MGAQARHEEHAIVDPRERVPRPPRYGVVHQTNERRAGLHVPAERRPDDETSRQVGLPAHEERGVRVAFGREVGGLAGEHAGIQGRVDDVASVIDEQQLASEPARETPDRRLLGEPGQESCGRPLEEVGVVSVRRRRGICGSLEHGRNSSHFSPMYRYMGYRH